MKQKIKTTIVLFLIFIIMSLPVSAASYFRGIDTAGQAVEIESKGVSLDFLHMSPDIKLPDLEDTARTINLSDEKFNKFVTKGKEYSHIAVNISDVVQGKEHFEETYGTEAAKLFTAVHGEKVHSEKGLKGRFRKNIN